MKLVALNREYDLVKCLELLELFPITAILGARQVGKTTLAKQLEPDHIFDLENPRDVTRLENPQFILENLSGLIMIDEIQRKPSLFPLLRYLVDQNKNQKFLILGSASPELKKQSGESLAGRIGYHYLSGFKIGDIDAVQTNSHWLRGGFPRSFLAKNDKASMLWRQNFIGTFITRDLAEMGIRVPAETMRRFWIMLSHYHGQIINYSELARSFGVSDKTVKNYIHILESAFMIRLLHPWHTNTKKRLVKHPKIYLQDSGLFHSLQNLQSFDDILSNPKAGASWEGFAIDQVIQKLGIGPQGAFFYATHSGAEVDLFWQSNGKNYAIECKLSDNPKTTKSMHQTIEDLDLQKLFVLTPLKKGYPLTKDIEVLSLTELDKLDK